MQPKIKPTDIATRKCVVSLQGAPPLPLEVVGTEFEFEGVKAKWLTHYSRFVTNVVDAEPTPPPAVEEE